MWFTIADIFGQKLCLERSKTGRCCCKKRKRGKHKGQSACDVTQTMIDAIGDGFTSTQPDEVIAHLQTKRCRNDCCNHKGCNEIDQAISSVSESQAA